MFMSCNTVLLTHTHIYIESNNISITVLLHTVRPRLTCKIRSIKVERNTKQR